MPANGQVARLVTEGCEEVGTARVEPRDAGVAWDQTEKLRHTLFGKVLWVFSLGHVCGTNLVLKSVRVVVVLIQKGGACISMMGSMVLADRTGLAEDSQWHASRSTWFELARSPAHADMECTYTRPKPQQQQGAR